MARTKWQILQERRAELADKLAKLDHQLEGLENTPCGLTCGKCGTYHETEKDFADHYVVSKFDEFNNLLNLGSCPNEQANPEN